MVGGTSEARPGHRLPQQLSARRDRERSMSAAPGSQPLHTLLTDAKASGWSGPAADRLIEAIEHRVINCLSFRLRAGLGDDEARQVAWMLAWEHCIHLADRRVQEQTWAYLGKWVHLQLSSQLRNELRRRRCHTLCGGTNLDSEPGSEVTHARLAFTEAEAPRMIQELGPALDALVAALESACCDQARRLVLAALDGPIGARGPQGVGRRGLIERAMNVGATRIQAGALAKLLGGHRGAQSVVARIARGEPPRIVLHEPVVRQRIICAAGAHADGFTDKRHLAADLHVRGRRRFFSTYSAHAPRHGRPCW